MCRQNPFMCIHCILSYFLGVTQFHTLTWPYWVRKHGIILCSIHFVFELHFHTSIYYIIMFIYNVYIYIFLCMHIFFVHTHNKCIWYDTMCKLTLHHKCHKCTLLGIHPVSSEHFACALLAGQDETQQLSIVIKQQEVRLGKANLDEFCLLKATQAKLV